MNYRILWIVALLGAGAGVLSPPAAIADEAERAAEVFESLYGEQVRRAAAGRSASEAAALAGRLRDAARAATETPALLGLLADAAYDLGLRDPAGYAAAAEAMTLLAIHVPDRRAEALDRILALRTRAYTGARGDDRPAAGERLIDALLAVAESKQHAGDAEGVARLLTRAVTVAGAVGSDRRDPLVSAREAARARQRADREVRQLRAAVAANPDNRRAAERLLRLYVVELDDPGGAAEFARLAGDEAWAEHVPLAAGPIDRVAADELLALGDWYRSLADEASAGAKANMLIRAADCYRRYLRVGGVGLSATQARLALEDARDRLEALGADPDASRLRPIGRAARRGPNRLQSLPEIGPHQRIAELLTVLDELGRQDHELLTGIERLDLAQRHEAPQLERIADHSDVRPAAGAYAGQVVAARDSLRNNHLVYGPYVSLPVGRYLLVARLMTDSATPGDADDAHVASVNVARSRGHSVADRPLVGRDVAGDEWRAFGLAFEVEREPWQGVEFRIWQASRPVIVDTFYLFRVDDPPGAEPAELTAEAPDPTRDSDGDRPAAPAPDPDAPSFFGIPIQVTE